MNKRYEEPEAIVNDCLEQLDREIIQIRTVLICSFAALFSIAIGTLI